MVVGSAHLFSDQYLDKEENSKLQEVIFRWLTSDDISLNPIDAEDPEVRRGGVATLEELGFISLVPRLYRHIYSYPD